MPVLKLDLLNKLRTDKFYDETELIRLGNDPNMNYKQKIHEMSDLLANIAVNNAQVALVEQYFQEQQPAPVTQQPQAGSQVHQGQTHGE